MSFHEVEFPRKLSYGSKGGPGFKTEIFESDSGVETRISLWEFPRHRYDVSYAVKSKETMADLRSFYFARSGAAYGFLFFDPFDHSTDTTGVGTASQTDATIGIGDGSETEFQLLKQYQSGSTTKSRSLRKPITGTVKVAVDGVLKTETTHYTVDYTTGIVTFLSAPADEAVVTAGCEFYVPVRFSKDTDEWLSVSYDDFSSQSSEIMLEEVKDSVSIGEELRLGGFADRCVIDPITLTSGSARVQLLEPSGTGTSMRLPAASSLSPGGPHFYIINVSATYSIEVKTSDGTTITTLGPGEGVTAIIGVDAGANALWYLI